MPNSLTSRVLSTSLDAWNNPWFIYLGAPLLAALGATIGVVAAPHVVTGEVPRALTVGGCVAVTMLVGFTIMALFDRGSNGP
jgi:hypothetical protein